MHAHRCPGCGFIWCHSDKSWGNVHDHTCIKCGAESWFKWDGQADCLSPQPIPA